MTRLKLILVTAAAAVAVTFVLNNPNSPPDSPGVNGQGSGASPGTSDAPTAIPKAKPSALGVAGGKTIYPSPRLSLPPDYVFASVGNSGPDEEPRPDGCEMYRKTLCKIHFKGTYRLSAFDTGSIQVGAYEDDKTEPVHKAALPIPRKGGTNWFVDLPYIISNTAKTVTFQAILLGPNGEILGEGARHRYRVRDKSTQNP